MPESSDDNLISQASHAELKALFVVGQIEQVPEDQHRIENNIQAALEEGVGDKGLMIKPRQLVEDYNLESGARIGYTGHGNVERFGKGNYGGYGQQIYVDYLGRKTEDIDKGGAGEKPLVFNISCHGGSASHPKDLDDKPIEGIDTLSVGSRKYPVQGITADSAAVLIAKNANKSNLELVGEVAIGVAESIRVNGEKITGPKPLKKAKEGEKEEYPVLDDEFLKQHLQEKLDKVADAMGYEANDPALEALREKANSEETIKSYREKMLNVAVQRGDIDKAQAIMDANSKAGASTAIDGKDALTYAVGSGNSEMTKMLLAKGADLEKHNEKSLALINELAGEEMGTLIAATQYIDDAVDKTLTKKTKSSEQDLKKAKKTAQMFSEDVAQDLGYDLVERMNNRATRGANSLREKGKADKADRIARQSQNIEEQYQQLQGKTEEKAVNVDSLKTNPEAFEKAINANLPEAIQLVNQETDIAAVVASQTNLDVKDVIARANLSGEKAAQFEEMVVKSQKRDDSEKKQAALDSDKKVVSEDKGAKKQANAEADRPANTRGTGSDKEKMNEVLKSDEFKQAQSSIKEAKRESKLQKDSNTKQETDKSMDSSGHSMNDSGHSR